MTQDIALEMERKYHCRYETGSTGSGLLAFPVTHVLDGPGKARFAHIGISNGELLNWCIMSETGEVLVHGHEQNYSRTRAGYVRMIRSTLQRIRARGSRRVYPRDATHRRGPARTADRWTVQGWPL